MGLCKDPVTKELNKRGYNLVKLPRVGIDPMDVLGRENDSMEKLGSIAEVWTSTAPVPLIGAPAPVAGVTGEKTSDLDAGIGLKLLADALAGLGAGLSLPSLNLAFKNAKKVQFKFINVESTSITPFALGKFLANGTLDMSNPFVSHYFGNDETQEHHLRRAQVRLDQRHGQDRDRHDGRSGYRRAQRRPQSRRDGEGRFDGCVGNHVRGQVEGHLRLQAVRGGVRERQVGADGRRRGRRLVIWFRRRRCGRGDNPASHDRAGPPAPAAVVVRLFVVVGGDEQKLGDLLGVRSCPDTIAASRCGRPASTPGGRDVTMWVWRRCQTAVLSTPSGGARCTSEATPTRARGS